MNKEEGEERRRGEKREERERGRGEGERDGREREMGEGRERREEGGERQRRGRGCWSDISYLIYRTCDTHKGEGCYMIITKFLFFSTTPKKSYHMFFNI
jgi:hypothetical protein